LVAVAATVLEEVTLEAQLRIAGLFAGIGGIELGFHRALGAAAKTDLLCEWWDPAKAVLEYRFPDVELHPDVRDLRELPAGIDVLAAGFPCTDLSQAGRTAGIGGAQSGLVGHVFDALRIAQASGGSLPWLLVENVPNMLALDKGKAMAYLVGEMESLGYRWAYRVVDSRFTGLPQRRRRVILLASTTEDPRTVLFREDAGVRPDSDYGEAAFGFYSTEGRGGLGWAQDATPTIKGGSTIGIASPPAIWVRDAALERRFVTPTIEDAEALQGFPRGWTQTPSEQKRGVRWKMVGNAVTTRVAEWVAGSLGESGQPAATWSEWEPKGAWPGAAWGESGKIFKVDVSEFPRLAAYESLTELVDLDSAPRLSHRAANGFWSRLSSGNLGRYPGFRDDVAAYASLDTTTFD
jgi:DNA (cytosine-5)-methyltransferase 1